MRQNRFACLLLKVAIVLRMCDGAAWGEPVQLSDGALSEVSGQGLLTLDNSSENGLNFSTLTLNADVALNANFQNIVLGQNGTATAKGAIGNINIPLLQFGVSNGTAAQQTVQITDPYIEFVYNTAANGSNGQVIGMRVGFDGISGNIGTLMNSINGALQIANGSTTLTANGIGSTSSIANRRFNCRKFSRTEPRLLDLHAVAGCSVPSRERSRRAEHRASRFLAQLDRSLDCAQYKWPSTAQRGDGHVTTLVGQDRRNDDDALVEAYHSNMGTVRRRCTGKCRRDADPRR